MRLVHRPGCLKGLNFSRMGNAGYDTIQYGFRPTDDSGREFAGITSSALQPGNSEADGPPTQRDMRPPTFSV